MWRLESTAPSNETETPLMPFRSSSFRGEGEAGLVREVGPVESVESRLHFCRNDCITLNGTKLDQD